MNKNSSNSPLCPIELPAVHLSLNDLKWLYSSNLLNESLNPLVIVNLLLDVPLAAKSGDLILSIICCRYILNLFSNLVKTFSFIYDWKSIFDGV